MEAAGLRIRAGDEQKAKEEVGAPGLGMEDKKFACIRSFENKF